jgi:hypothetical protein
LSDRELKSHKNIKLIKGYLEDSVDELKKNSYDLILLSSLLHEIPDVELFLKGLFKLAGKDTLIHINVPNADSFHRLLALEMGLVHSQFDKSESNYEFQQNIVFNMESLKNVFINAGFRVVEEGSYSLKPFTHYQMQSMIDSGILNFSVLEGLFKMEKYISGLGSEIYINVIVD